MPAQLRTAGPDCRCTGCLIWSDNFHRDDETIDDAPATDSTGEWVCLGTSAPEAKWQILSEELAIDVPAGLAASDSRPYATHAITTRHYRAISAEVRLTLPAPGASVAFDLVLSAEAGSSIAAGVRLTADSDPYGDCGTLQIREDGEDTSNTIPIVGLTAGTHAVKLCLDFDLQIISVKVSPGSGPIQYHHKKRLDTQGDVSQTEFTIRPDQTTEGLFTFDNVKISELQVLSDYGYDYGENDCPCCSAGCQVTDASAQDCRWFEESGSWSNMETSDADARLLWNGSSSGLDVDCQIDETTMVRATFVGEMPESQIVIIIGEWVVTITLSAEYANDGTVQIGDQDPVTVPGLLAGIPITVRVCWDGDNLVVAVLTARLEAIGASDGDAVRIGTGSVAGPTHFTGIEISHNIYSTGCDDCDSGDELVPCDVCRTGLISPTVIVRFHGLGFVTGIPYGPPGQCVLDGGESNDPGGIPNLCTLIESTTFILKGDNSCAWTPARDPAFNVKGTATSLGCPCEWVSDGTCIVQIGVGFSVVAGRLVASGFLSTDCLSPDRSTSFELDLGPSDELIDCDLLLAGGLLLPVKPRDPFVDDPYFCLRATNPGPVDVIDGAFMEIGLP